MGDPRARKASQAALMASAQDTEFAFYEALRSGNVDRLMSVWADDADIACVHPGGPRVVGVASIRAAFEAIFLNGPVQVSVEHVRRLESSTCSVHHVLEMVQAPTPDGLMTAFVLATNVYMRTELGWRMVSHHASPGQAQVLQEIVDPVATLH